MFYNLRADAKRYLGETHGIEKLKRLLYLFTTQEFYAVVIFRYGKYVQKVRIPIVGLILRIIYFILNKLIAEICAGVLMDLGSEIGKGFHLGHFGGIYIKATIGENCTVAQQAVIGYKGGFSGGEVPTLGNNVFVGSGAKIIGSVKIGNNVKIGANAVVLTDIPDNSTAVGIPAKVVKQWA